MSYLSDNNKRIAKNTIFLYGQLFFSVIVGLYTSRVILRTLGVEDFGIYNLVGGFVTLLTIFTFSISGTCQRFIVYELGKNDKIRLSETFCTISLLLMIFSAIFFLVAASFGPWVIGSYLNIPSERTNAAIIVYFCSLSVFCFKLLAVPYSSLVIAHEKMGFYALMNLTETVGKLLVVISISIISWDKLVYYAVSLAVISLVVRIIYSIYCRSNFSESKLFFIFRKDIFKNITSFAFWVGFGSFAGVLKDQGGAIIVNVFFGVALNATMGIASQVKSLVNQLSSNIGLAITPQITKSYSSGNHERAIQLTFLLAKAQTYMMLLLALPIIVETPRLLQLWLGDYPEYSVVFVRVILLLSVAQALEISYGPIFLAIGKVKRFELIVSLITLLVLPLTYLCYYFDFHPTSYYFVCITFEIILFLYSYNWLRKEISFPLGTFFKEIVVKLLIICVLTLGAMLGLYQLTIYIPSSIIQMFFNIILCVICYSVTTYYLGLKPRERELVKGFVKTKVLRKK